MDNSDFIQALTKQDFWPGICPNSDTVLSSRVQLTRNIFGIPFVHRQTPNDINQIKLIVGRFIRESQIRDLELVDINAIDDSSKRFLRERDIITESMEIAENCFVILSKNDDFSILINNEDHLVIQVARPGLQLADAYKYADEVDNRVNKYAVYAFSEERGYILANPLAGDLRVTAMVHLPVLGIMRRMNEVRGIAKLNRISIEGLKEGMKTFGNLFNISSEYTAGIPESKVIENIEKAIRSIIGMESDSRESYLAEHGIKIEDKICRSYGILKFSRKIGYVEAMEYLSDLRLGIILSVIKSVSLQLINHLMINIQWSHLQKIAEKKFASAAEGDVFRASYIRDQLEWSTING